MQQNILLAAVLATYATAVPLNINLGAYSPALVVGDGEISFGGKADVTNLMNALEGAAVSGAAANGAAAPATPATTQPAQAAAAQPGTPAPQADGQQATQIASLQGMGKEIAPRVVRLAERAVEGRDLSGFDRALKYAADAIKTTPEINLGTEASGVGILQKAGSAAGGTNTGTQPKAAGGQAPAQAPAAAKVKSRDETVSPKMKTTVTTMFVRGGPAPASKERSAVGSLAVKRDPSPGLDGVNLNMAEGQVAELTFVETRAVGANEDEE
ncbi:hypothetical protein G7Y89_g2227 [Cudoniella acicularis]|uniref:Uncharacterized protein n=1 Tax=Cudoniella acicularis TaxID=354080 RepID=A0A8H4W6A3_9HELO|nr:hypothetical protein G7Y89_g2227 [Cudoniella acicularis]